MIRCGKCGEYHSWNKKHVCLSTAPPKVIAALEDIPKKLECNNKPEVPKDPGIRIMRCGW